MASPVAADAALAATTWVETALKVLVDSTKVEVSWAIPEIVVVITLGTWTTELLTKVATTVEAAPRASASEVADGATRVVTVLSRSKELVEVCSWPLIVIVTTEAVG